MIPKELVQQEATEVLEEQELTELTFLNGVAKTTISFLKSETPDFWKNYGMYWWNMMEILKQHDPRGFREYAAMVGGEQVFGKDEEMRKKYDYGSDALNWIAAQMYLEERAESGLGPETPHYHVDEDENERAYIPSVGFVDEREEDGESSTIEKEGETTT